MPSPRAEPGDRERAASPPGERERGLPVQIGAYPVAHLIGRGGTGTVYAAEDPRLHRPVAIKVLHPESALDLEGLARFEREAHLLATVNHPSIAMVYSLETAGDLHFLTMELVGGETLATRVGRGPIDLDRSLAIARQMAGALEAAHAAGVIHLDLKPANVMLTREGQVKLLDFGLARTRAAIGPETEIGPEAPTLDRRIQGSPGYMSPEQLRADAFDGRCDIWAFGCVLFEMISGIPAFPGRTAPDRIASTLESAPGWAALSADTPVPIRELIEQCLQKDAGLRPESMTAVRRLLEDETAHRRNPAPPSLPRAGPDAHPTNLPLLLTSFIGRHGPMEQLAQSLERERLVTITGPGGCGKTRLAQEAGRSLLHRFPDGVWMAELAPVTEAEMIPSALARGLGVREDSKRPLLDTLRSYLKTRELLLVLDNCEHLVAPSAHLVESLLAESPRLRVLATSRERLGVAGESILLLAPLAVPDPVQPGSVRELEQVDSVRLFLERARASDAAFAITPENAPFLAQICQRLDGLPLALELAASRVSALAVEEIAQRLDDRFQLLTAGSRTVLPRHQTLRALIDWSFDSLSESERRLFRRLAVFTGSWSFEAAEVVCGGDGLNPWEILDLHCRLVDRSLVERDLKAGRRGGQVRYRMLETIHEYARDRLQEASEEAAVRSRHRSYYHEQAINSSVRLVGPKQGEWSQRLEAEHGNLRAAIASACGRGPEQDEAQALRVAASLGRYWYTRGRWTEGRALMKAILALPGAQARDAFRAQALAWTGWIALWQGDLVEAWTTNQEGLSIRRELDDRMGIAQSLNNLGAIAQERGEFRESRVFYEESLAIRRAAGNLRYQAVSLHNLGELCLRMGLLDEARAYNEEALQVRRQVGDVMGVADSLNALGMVAECSGDLARARRCHEESLANRQEREDPMGIAESLHRLAGIDEREGHLDRARAAYAKSIGIRARLGDRLDIAESLESIGILAVAATAL